MADKISTTITGAAAEHYVMCQLLRRNMIAALAPTGVPDADIIVSDRIGSALAAVQVKARRDIGRDGGWHMHKKHEIITRDLLFYCFVDFGKTIQDSPRCWIIPSAIVSEALKKSHKAWLDAPGLKGRKHKDHDMRRLIPDYGDESLPQYRLGWLDPFADAWDLIARSAHQNSN